MDEQREGLAAAMSDLLGATAELADRWVELDADTVTVDEAGELMAGLDRQINRLEGARSKLAGSFARRQGHRRSGHKDLAHWMQDRLRRSPTQARKEARTAERLGGLSSTSDALGRGDISLEHAAAIAEQAAKSEDPEGAQRSLLDEAQRADPGRVRKAGRRMRRDEARRAEDARKVRMAKQNRTLTFRADDTEKTMWVEGRLPMIGGVKIRTVLDALAAPTGRDDGRSYGQRMADALVDLAERAEDGRGLPTQRGLPVEVMAVVPVEAVERRAGVPAGTICGGPGGGIDLCDAELAELLERAELSWLIVDPEGVPLRFGKGRRFASADQRRVLRARDGGCAWPRCDAPAAWTVAHHEPPFDESGGATDLELLVAFCDTHHGLRHEAGWIVDLSRTGTITVTSADGRTTLTETAQERRARHGTWELSVDTRADAASADAASPDAARDVQPAVRRAHVGRGRDVRRDRLAREEPAVYRARAGPVGTGDARAGPVGTGDASRVGSRGTRSGGSGGSGGYGGCQWLTALCRGPLGSLD